MDAVRGIYICEIVVYSSYFVLQLPKNSAQLKFSTIRRQTTETAIPSSLQQNTSSSSYFKVVLKLANVSYEKNFILCIFLALFSGFDENNDGHIDFRELACGISTCCRGPLAERFACKVTFATLNNNVNNIQNEWPFCIVLSKYVYIISG